MSQINIHSKLRFSLNAVQLNEKRNENSPNGEKHTARRSII